jgi:restriction system protein
MSVPDFQSFFKPLLELASDCNEHSIKEAREKLANYFEMTDDDLSELLPSRTQKTFDNRVAWAKSYFIQAKVLKATKRAHFMITDRGAELYNQGHDRIDIKILNQYPEFREFHKAKKSSNDKPKNDQPSESSTPEELLQQSYQNIRDDLASELLNRIMDNSPEFFEKLVVDLMVAMGYGGSRLDAGRSIGRSGDEGIDGIIKEDRLGLDVIYLQAKKWENAVSRPEIQKFVGALHGKRAKKGVFITTSSFSKSAREYVEHIDPKVVLIDGTKLANYMIDFNLGTTTSAIYEIKRADTDYFIED